MQSLLCTLIIVYKCTEVHRLDHREGEREGGKAGRETEIHTKSMTSLCPGRIMGVYTLGLLQTLFSIGSESVYAHYCS